MRSEDVRDVTAVVALFMPLLVNDVAGLRGLSARASTLAVVVCIALLPVVLACSGTEGIFLAGVSMPMLGGLRLVLSIGC